jgi:hypothetical protein
MDLFEIFKYPLFRCVHLEGMPGNVSIFFFLKDRSEVLRNCSTWPAQFFEAAAASASSKNSSANFALSPDDQVNSRKLKS